MNPSMIVFSVNTSQSDGGKTLRVVVNGCQPQQIFLSNSISWDDNFVILGRQEWKENTTQRVIESYIYSLSCQQQGKWDILAPKNRFSIFFESKNVKRGKNSPARIVEVVKSHIQSIFTFSILNSRIPFLFIYWKLYQNIPQNSHKHQ